MDNEPLMNLLINHSMATHSMCYLRFIVLLIGTLLPYVIVP